MARQVMDYDPNDPYQQPWDEQYQAQMNPEPQAGQDLPEPVSTPGGSTTPEARTELPAPRIDNGPAPTQTAPDLPFGLSSLPPGVSAADLNPGARGKYYAPGEHGPGEPAMIGLPDGYYVLDGPGGTWGRFNPRGPEGAAAPQQAPQQAYQPPQIQVPDYMAQYSAALRQILMSQLGQLQGPTTADSPELQPAIGAYTTQSQRDEQAARDQLAEQEYAGSGSQGLHTGAFKQAVAKNREVGSGNRANFVGSTVYQAAQAKRQQLQAMLQTATSFGLADQAQSIQAQIAQIDANLRSQGLNQQNGQFYAGLGQQGSQFNTGMGYNYAALTAQMNRDALLAGLGG